MVWLRVALQWPAESLSRRVTTITITREEFFGFAGLVDGSKTEYVKCLKNETGQCCSGQADRQRALGVDAARRSD